MLSIRFLYFVATITVLIVKSYSILVGASELRVAHQAALFGLTDDEGNEYIECTFYKIFFAKCFFNFSSENLTIAQGISDYFKNFS